MTLYVHFPCPYCIRSNQSLLSIPTPPFPLHELYISRPCTPQLRFLLCSLLNQVCPVGSVGISVHSYSVLIVQVSAHLSRALFPVHSHDHLLTYSLLYYLILI